MGRFLKIFGFPQKVSRRLKSLFFRIFLSETRFLLSGTQLGLQI